MFSGLKSIRKERASLERNRVLITSMMEDAHMSDAFMAADENFFEGVSIDEIDELINKLPESDEEDAQIQRILASDEDMDIDEIIGVE